METFGGHTQGGGLLFGNVIHQNGRDSKYNTYNTSNCLFEENQATTSGSFMGFVHYKAQFGPASIQINRQFFDSIITSSIITLVLKNCNFTANNPYTISSIEAVAMSRMNIEFWGYTHFSNNTSTALMVDIATVELRNGSVTSF